MSAYPFIDFHTHASGCQQYHTTTNTDVIVVQSVFYAQETPHQRANYLSVGIHPMQEEKVAFKKEKLLEYGQRVIAVGECGWDTRSPLPIEQQELLVRQQLAVAEEMVLPVVFHIVGGWHRLLALRKEHPNGTWVAHGFRGKPALLAQLYKANIWVSLHPCFSHWQALEPSFPFFLETDDTPLTDIRNLYNTAATQLHLSPEELQQRVYSNFQEFIK